MLASFSLALLAAAATASSVQAQATAAAAGGSTVGSPKLIQCQTAAFKYECLDPPCSIAMRPSDDSGESYAYFQDFTEASGSLPWKPYVPAGTNLTAYIYDAGGNPNYSGALIVAKGVEDDCAKDTGSGASSAASESGASSSSSGSKGAAASASSKAGAAVANATESAGDAAATAAGSGAGKLMQGGAALALVAAGAALLF